MSKRKTPGKPVVGYGWCGTYNAHREHRLGWLLTRYVSHKSRECLERDQMRALGKIPNTQFADSDMWRVKITIEPIKDRRGRYIVRRSKRDRSKT